MVKGCRFCQSKAKAKAKAKAQTKAEASAPAPAKTPMASICQCEDKWTCATYPSPTMSAEGWHRFYR